MRKLSIVLFLVSIWGTTVAQNIAFIPNITYTTASGYPQQLDLYWPSPLGLMAKRPAIVFVHGGGWVAGSKEDFGGFANYFALRGYVTITINYRLTPAHVWPAQIDDCQGAVRWLRKNASVLGVDRNRIGACGGSAGGHLVLWMGAADTLNDFDPDLRGFSSKVQSVVDYYGPSDLTRKQEWDPSIWSLIESLVGKTFNGDTGPFAAASPVFALDSGDAPTLIFQGDADPIVPVSQSREEFAAMLRLGVPVEYHEFRGEGHGFSGYVFWQTILLMVSFLNRTLK